MVSICWCSEEHKRTSCGRYKKMFTKSEEDDIILPGWYSEKKLYLIIYFETECNCGISGSYNGACIA